MAITRAMWEKARRTGDFSYLKRKHPEAFAVAMLLPADPLDLPNDDPEEVRELAPELLIADHGFDPAFAHLCVDVALDEDELEPDEIMTLARHGELAEYLDLQPDGYPEDESDPHGIDSCVA